MKDSGNQAITVSNLTIVYEDRMPHLTVIQDMSFSVGHHEFVSIIGPSGCGKSTLFNVVADLIPHERIGIGGVIKVQGVPPETARKGRKIGVIFQKPTLLDWRTIEENISLPLEIMSRGKSDITRKISRFVSLVGLEEYRGYYPFQLSGGMQQKVSIARALAYDPPVLLMDEPFAALDEINRRNMNRELLTIWRETQKTILFVTHSISEAVYLSQRIIVLSDKPGTIRDIIPINLPYPRDSADESKRFFDYVIKVKKALNGAYA